jgi:hypothetical protein
MQDGIHHYSPLFTHTAQHAHRQKIHTSGRSQFSVIQPYISVGEGAADALRGGRRRRLRYTRRGSGGWGANACA